MLTRRLLADPGLPRPNPTTSYWQQEYEQAIPNVRSQNLPTYRDVVILGSGITACSAAQRLLEGNGNSSPPSVTILEARGLCSGATGRNGGHIKFNAVFDYAKHKARLGHEAAAEIVRFSMSHYDAISAAAERLGAADIGEVRKVTAATCIMDPSMVPEAKAALVDFEDAFPEHKGQYSIYEAAEAEKKFSVSRVAAVLASPAGAAWPYRLVTAIYRALLATHADKFSIETFTPAQGIDRSDNAEYPYKIQTPRGYISAKHVIHCTEAHSSHLLPQLRGIIWPLKDQMTVHTPGDRLAAHRGEFSWSFIFRDFFDYMTQNAKTGEIFIGGGDVGAEGVDFPNFATVSDDEELDLNKIHLCGILPVIFNDLDPKHQGPKLKASWTGLMGFSIDGYPLVGKLPDEALPHTLATTSGCEWIAAGFGGYGMVNSWGSGKAVAEMVLNGGNAPKELPTRYLMSQQRFTSLEKELEIRMTRGMSTGDGFKALL
ncbi:FAD dependent oxidoreductase [Xylariales sp. PMI_506]|nr:FAD dependent oxidoreductase [Xylariales sp. PMI_506]